MYTRCPHCQTVFRVSAEQLGLAQGSVRCGDCNRTFNALESLTDRPPDDSAEPVLPQMNVDDDPDTEDQPTRDRHGEMEFDVPQQRWADFFLEALPDPGHAPGPVSDTSGQLAVAARDDADAPPWSDDPGEDSEPVSKNGSAFGLWSAVLFLTLLLTAQLVHQNRDALAADTRFASAVNFIYRWFDATLYPEWPIDVFQIRNSEVIGGAAGALRMIAEVEISGEEPVGLPMIKIVLRDRWANEVAAGIFPASDYLPDDQPTSDVVSPGTRVPVNIVVADPGSEAQGYEIDVCLPQRHAGLRCQTERNPFQR